MMALRSLRALSSTVGAAAQSDGAAAGAVGFDDAAPADDDAAGREIRSPDVPHQLVLRQRGVVDQCAAGVDHFAQIVRRDVGRHADGDAAGAVHQQVRQARRQHLRLLRGLVVVRLEVDGVFVDVRQQALAGQACQARLGVAHGRRRVGVDRAEVALPVDQQGPQRPGLRHAHHRVVDRLAAVRVVLAHHVADDSGRLAVGPVPVVAGLLHRVEDAAVHRLQAIAHVGQRASHDHAHRVIEVGAPHLLFDGDRDDAGLARLWGTGRRRNFAQGQLALGLCSMALQGAADAQGNTGFRLMGLGGRVRGRAQAGKTNPPEN